ncbi:hypothetical protein [Moorena producens]|uniref:hypothetical protein n=1 Tax=Moorena producens TaxID=1155739 RepID=UPI001438FA9F|nr:hypothetical protein [Moorena producens]
MGRWGDGELGRWGDGESDNYISLYPFLLACLLLACLLPLNCSLLPAPYSLKPRNFYLISIKIAIYKNAIVSIFLVSFLHLL